MNDLHLERRGQLAPLAETTERDLQTDPFSTLYVSPCQIQVSNDPFDEPLDVLDLIPCNLKQYGCPGRQDGPTIDIPVEYDFEIHYDTSADFDTTMKALEGASLQHAANLAGLLDCNPTETAVERQNGNNLRRLNRYLQSLLTDEEKAALIGISSDPEDTADPDISEWMADYYGRACLFCVVQCETHIICPLLQPNALSPFNLACWKAPHVHPLREGSLPLLTVTPLVQPRLELFRDS